MGDGIHTAKVCTGRLDQGGDIIDLIARAVRNQPLQAKQAAKLDFLQNTVRDLQQVILQVKPRECRVFQLCEQPAAVCMQRSAATGKLGTAAPDNLFGMSAGEVVFCQFSCANSPLQSACSGPLRQANSAPPRRIICSACLQAKSSFASVALNGQIRSLIYQCCLIGCL